MQVSIYGKYMVNTPYIGWLGMQENRKLKTNKLSQSPSKLPCRPPQIFNHQEEIVAGIENDYIKYMQMPTVVTELYSYTF